MKYKIEKGDCVILKNDLDEKMCSHFLKLLGDRTVFKIEDIIWEETVIYKINGCSFPSYLFNKKKFDYLDYL